MHWICTAAASLDTKWSRHHISFQLFIPPVFDKRAHPLMTRLNIVSMAICFLYISIVMYSNTKAKWYLHYAPIFNLTFSIKCTHILSQSGKQVPKVKLQNRVQKYWCTWPLLDLKFDMPLLHFRNMWKLCNTEHFLTYLSDVDK